MSWSRWERLRWRLRYFVPHRWRASPDCWEAWWGPFNISAVRRGYVLWVTGFRPTVVVQISIWRAQLTFFAFLKASHRAPPPSFHATFSSKEPANAEHRSEAEASPRA